MWRWSRYIRSMRSRALASASVARVGTDPPMDRSPIAPEEPPPFSDMAAPAGEIARGKQLLERRAGGGGAEDDPGARSRGPPDLPPQRGQGRSVHPVDAVEQDIAIAAFRGLSAEPIGHRRRVGGDARYAVADGLVISRLQVRRQRRGSSRAVAPAESLPGEIVVRQGEVASQMPHPIAIEPGEIAARLDRKSVV